MSLGYVENKAYYVPTKKHSKFSVLKFDISSTSEAKKN